MGRFDIQSISNVLTLAYLSVCNLKQCKYQSPAIERQMELIEQRSRDIFVERLILYLGDYLRELFCTLCHQLNTKARKPAGSLSPQTLSSPQHEFYWGKNEPGPIWQQKLCPPCININRSFIWNHACFNPWIFNVITKQKNESRMFIKKMRFKNNATSPRWQSLRIEIENQAYQTLKPEL